MAKDKEKSVNPAQAQRKAEKAKAIKKGKAEQATRRTEKLARRNPTRLQKQLDELKALESSGQKLTNHEKTILESLEKDLKAVTKAREALGDRAPKFGGGGVKREDGDRRGDGKGGVLGKRRREGGDEGSSSDGEEVNEDVKRIPMPRDTPPPVPKAVLDEWWRKRRERLGIPERGQQQSRGEGTSANRMPLGDNERKFGNGSGSGTGEAMARPKMEAKTVYEAKPVVRDLRKEAVSFVPAAVKRKLDMAKGVGGLVEPEEMDRLEKEGYIGGGGKSAEVEKGKGGSGKAVMMEEVEDEDA